MDGNTLYFNNPSLGTFARVTMDPSSGRKVGDVNVITSGLGPDHFEIDEQQLSAYMTNPVDKQLLRIGLATGLYDVVADGLPGPTTARWISEKERGKVLYVATGGGVDEGLAQNVTLGGAIYRVSVKA
ncbi:hypothetical protein H2200_004824 [Cladophialophora chaetospira]|uniref:SMP-30/Gluconolactonase/LRE-like region domain-containing protein n=1 Tax=Cladophialophora chaetospira TaxID=386627 RepID=A0AA38XDZ5_9EURO|nr:hypothetical protein H2200_004824 [Cladophialophora chaetospira]